MYGFHLKYFGHKPNLVSVLDGGFQKWLKENRKPTNKISNHEKVEQINYQTNENI